MEKLELVQNDVNFDLEFQLKRGYHPYDLTNATSVLFKMGNTDMTTTYVNGSCTIYDARKGKCRYTVQSGDLATAGTYYAEIEVHVNSTIFTTELFKIEVREELP